MPNPLVSQGSLSRIRGSVTWSSNPSLNVTAPFLSKEAIRLSLQGESTRYLETLTGAVTSPNVMMMIEMQINLLKTQGLSALYKSTMEFNSLIGDGIVRPDATGITPYQIINCAIKSVREMDYSGENAAWTVVIGGYYLVNSFLFDIT